MQPYNVESWRNIVTRMAPAVNVPVTAVMSWMAVESAGKPGAVGGVDKDGFVARDAEGNILETGLFQLYSPGEIVTAGTTVAKMRVNCSVQDGKGRAAIEAMIRPLTNEQATEHIRAGLQFLTHQLRKADEAIASVTSRRWSDWDRWALAKLRHGLPMLAGTGLRAVTSLTRRPPTGYAELVALLPAVRGSLLVKTDSHPDGTPVALDKVLKAINGTSKYSKLLDTREVGGA